MSEPVIPAPAAFVTRGQALTGSAGTGLGVGLMWVADHYFAAQAASSAATLKMSQDTANVEIVAGLMELLRACQAGG